jgi:phosphoribosylglycinamide formyltransferase-1
MKYNYAFYCSGSASRFLKFYEKENINSFNFSFVYYDGNKPDIIDFINKTFEKSKLFVPDAKNLSELKGGSISEYISNEILVKLNEYNIDYLFCFGDKILKPKLVDAYANKIINFHPSILPSFPGLNAIDKALNSSVQILGNTAHFIDHGIDTGPIILQSIISRSSYIGYHSVLDLQIEMLKKIWMWLEYDKIVLKDGKVEIDSLNSLNFFSA